jgi:excisionase family DNA binding protein
MRQELVSVLNLAQSLALEELPDLLGQLETVRLVAHGRLINAPAVATGPDTSLTVAQAATRLGVSTDYIYRNQQKYSKFMRREGRKILFSSAGLEKYLRKLR